LADADELVGEAVVAEERDEGRDGFGLFGHGSLPAGGLTRPTLASDGPGSGARAVSRLGCTATGDTRRHRRPAPGTSARPARREGRRPGSAGTPSSTKPSLVARLPEL